LTPLLWVAVVWAGEGAPSAPASPPPGPLEVGFTGALVKMVGGLAGVLALVLILYWLLRRFMPGQGIPLKGARMRVLGRLGLGQRAQVALVRVGEEVLILGVTPGSVTLLDKLDGTQELEAGGDNQGGASGGFAQTLRRAAEEEDQ